MFYDFTKFYSIDKKQVMVKSKEKSVKIDLITFENIKICKNTAVKNCFVILRVFIVLTPDQTKLPLVIDSSADGQQDGEDRLDHGAETTSGCLHNNNNSLEMPPQPQQRI